MEKHLSAGKVVQLTDGPHKDKYFVVIDFLVNQFQGKDIKNIAKAHPDLVRELFARKKLDDKAVFGYMYPSKDHTCVHDDDLKVLSKSDAKRLEVLKGGKDDTGKSSAGDNQDAEPGKSGGAEGRSVSSGEELTEVESPFTDYPDESESSGSEVGGHTEESNGDDKPKAKGRAKGSGTRGKAKSKK